MKKEKVTFLYFCVMLISLTLYAIINKNFSINILEIYTLITSNLAVKYSIIICSIFLSFIYYTRQNYVSIVVRHKSIIRFCFISFFNEYKNLFFINFIINSIFLIFAREVKEVVTIFVYLINSTIILESLNCTIKLFDIWIKDRKISSIFCFGLYAILDFIILEFFYNKNVLLNVFSEFLSAPLYFKSNIIFIWIFLLLLSFLLTLFVSYSLERRDYITYEDEEN